MEAVSIESHLCTVKFPLPFNFFFFTKYQKGELVLTSHKY